MQIITLSGSLWGAIQHIKGKIRHHDLLDPKPFLEQTKKLISSSHTRKDTAPKQTTPAHKKKITKKKAAAPHKKKKVVKK